jgi:hypothetical protein
MRSALVPPTDPINRETIIVDTKPNSLKRKIKLALFKFRTGRKVIGFPYVLWLLNKQNKNKK